MIPLAQTKEETFFAFGHITQKIEVLPAANATGRVLVEPVFAAISSPPFHVAAMDGYALFTKVTFHASESHPAWLEEDLRSFAVNTGEVLPEGRDAVVMIEKVIPEESRLRLEAPVFPWQHVRKIDEDIVATEMLFPATHEITPTASVP